jgi:hypothetical protein
MQFRAIGFEAWVPYWISWVTEAHRRRGRVEGLLAVSEKGIATVESTGDRIYEAEVHRLRGEQELREAQRLFLEIEAPIHAERIAKELRS